ncbi:MAG: hypothetical protein FD136_1457 [Chitinophagaceae bacterium]|nr:MAG: hypothetical protein FD136_1457 [Chitinophagaceae bacterium]
MKFTQEKALFHLTGKTDIAELKMETIEKMVNEYPFFSPGHYLFSAKLKKDDHPLAASQAIKTALYFSNPYWLQYQLDSLKEVGIDQAPKQEMDTALLRSIHQKDKEWDEMINLPKMEETMEESTRSLEMPTLPNPDFVIPTVESVKEMMRGIDSFTQPSTIIPVIRDTVVAQPIESIIPERPKPTIEPIKESTPEPYSPVFSTIASSELAPEQEYSAQPESNRILPDQEKSDAKIASILSGQLAEFKRPIEQDAVLEIDQQQEKLHTIDYFASQGIQIDLSKIPQDKLTTKLRRFTDWLKDMKNHSPNPADLGTSPESEKAVAVTALVSNESKEILTDTMAEVLVKQGQIDKAIQLYIKLSFSNPEKTAYFAAKIQQLKGI